MLYPTLVDCEASDSVGDAQNSAAVGGNRAPRETSTLGTVLLLIKCTFGCFGFMVPGGCRSTGLLGAPVILLFVVAFEVTFMFRLIECRRVMGPGKRFEDLAVDWGGRWGGRLVSFFLASALVGFMSLWFVILVDNLSKLVPSWDPSTRLWVQVPILILLLLVRHLKFFAATSVLGIVAQVVTMVYLFYLAAHVLSTQGVRDVKVVNTDISDVVIWMGSCFYSLELVPMLLPMYEAAQDKKGFFRLLTLVSGTVMLVYIVFGIVFYLAFGEDTKSMATLNIPEGSMWGKLLPGCIILVGLVSVPIDGLVLAQMYEPLIPWSSGPRVRKWQKNVVRTLLLLAVAVLTWVGGDQLQNLLALVGGFSCSFLSLIMPAILHKSICRPGPMGRFMDVFAILLGLFILVTSTSWTLLNWGKK